MPLQSKGGTRTLVPKENKEKEEVRLNANDTDFILKLFMESTFKGSEINKAHGVLSKLAILHRGNLNG
tara:strand:- start:277 stop:480 length:204 start_codon:yes stop_codon:yes gene_type:complete